MLVGRSRTRLAGGATLAAIVVIVVQSAAHAESVGDPLPDETQAWDALGADFDGLRGRDVVLTRHAGTVDELGGIYYADGAGGFNLGFRFPQADRHGCDAGDVNGDGRLDLYCEVGADRGTGIGRNELWIQVPGGPRKGFVDRAATWGVEDPYGRGRKPLLYDHNGDGRVDVYLTVWGPRADDEPNWNRLFINQGSRFAERSTAATGWRPGSRCVTDADWNADGHADLIVCGNEAGANTLRLFKNNGVGGHQDVSFLLGTDPLRWPQDAQVADLNGDGLQDLVVVLTNTIQIRLNQGAGNRFSQVSFQAPLAQGRRALIGDLIGDGSLDIYVSNGCDATGAPAPDIAFVGPTWAQVSVPPAEGAYGCGGEVVDAGRLVTFDGTEGAVGTVTVRGLPLRFP